jgi:hypothetical protein
MVLVYDGVAPAAADHRPVDSELERPGDDEAPSSGNQKRMSPRPASNAPGTRMIVRLSINSMIAIDTVSAASAIRTTALTSLPFLTTQDCVASVRLSKPSFGSWRETSRVAISVNVRTGNDGRAHEAERREEQPRARGEMRGGSAEVAGPQTPAGGAVPSIGAGLSGALLDVSHGWPMTGMLALLGLGWNAGVVGGTRCSPVPCLRRCAR